MPTVQEQLALIRKGVSISDSIPVQPLRSNSNQGSRLAAGFQEMNQSVLALTNVVGEVDVKADQGAANTARINGDEPDARDLLLAAFSDNTLTIALTGTFNLTQPIRVTRGAHVVYLVDALLSSVLSADGESMFELEDGAILMIYSRNSDLLLTGYGNSNALFSAETENFTLAIDGGAIGSTYGSALSYTGTNARCIKVVGAQVEALLPANFSNLEFTGSGTGEQFTDTGSPRLVVNSMANCVVSSRYLAVKSVEGAGLAFTGGSVAVTHHATVLGITINQAPTDPSGSVIFPNLTADRIVVNATYPGGLGAVVGLTAGPVEINGFFYDGSAGVGTTVSLNWVGSHVTYIQTFTPTGVFHVNFDGQNEVINVNNATDVNVSLGSRWVLAGDLVNILGIIDIAATFISDLEVFTAVPGPHSYHANFIDSCLLNGTSRFLPGPQGPEMGISNTRMKDVEIGPGISLVQMANINMSGFALSGAGPGTESPVRGTNCVVGTAVGASPVNSVTLRASTGIAGANAVITDP